MIRALTIAAVAAVASVASAMPASVSWDVPAGSQPLFDYADGKSDLGLFGSGIAHLGGFILAPEGLNATGLNNTTEAVGDTVSVVLTAKPNHQFTQISSGMFGDYSLLGDSTADSIGQLRVTNLDTSSVLWQNLTYTGVPAATLQSDDGFFSGTASIALPAGWKNILVQFDGQVSAYGDNGAAAFIETKGASIDVQAAVVPLPAAVFAAPAALFIAYRARRKMMGK